MLNDNLKAALDELWSEVQKEVREDDLFEKPVKTFSLKEEDILEHVRPENKVVLDTVKPTFQFHWLKPTIGVCIMSTPGNDIVGISQSPGLIPESYEDICSFLATSVDNCVKELIGHMGYMVNDLKARKGIKKRK